MMNRVRPYPESSVAWDEAFRQRQRADDLEAACRAVLDALEKLAADGAIIWLDPPHVLPGVHESAIERLKSVIAQVEVRQETCFDCGEKFDGSTGICDLCHEERDRIDEAEKAIG
jgi:hypothetical protein